MNAVRIKRIMMAEGFKIRHTMENMMLANRILSNNIAMGPIHFIRNKLQWAV
jgi:hypothetical protein